MSGQHNTAPEIWKPIPSTDGFYEASSIGRIRRGERVVFIGGILFDESPPRIVKSHRNNRGGYRVVTVRAKAWNQQTRFVHRLVCEAFHGVQPSPRMDVHHKNNQRDDNRSENLEWVTRQQNIVHSYSRGGRKRPAGTRTNNATRLTDSEVRTIKVAYAQGETARSLAKRFGITWHYAIQIVNGKRREKPSTHASLRV